ncbi:MAG: hypothetical protein ACRC1K_21615 [Planctomycetia bacterium]
MIQLLPQFTLEQAPADRLNLLAPPFSLFTGVVTGPYCVCVSSAFQAGTAVDPDGVPLVVMAVFQAGAVLAAEYQGGAAAASAGCTCEDD